MPIDEENEQLPDASSDYVPVVFGRDASKADEYRELLSDFDIPAMVGSDEELGDKVEAEIKARKRGMTHGLPVLVPEAFLDEASEIIADNESADDPDLDEDEEVQDEEGDDDEFLLDELEDDPEEESLSDYDDDFFADDSGGVDEDDL